MPSGRDYVPSQLRLVGQASVEENIYEKLRIFGFMINLHLGFITNFYVGFMINFYVGFMINF